MVWLAIAAFVIAALAWLFAPKQKMLGRIGAWSFGIGCVSVLGSFSVLASLFATMRLEYDYVWGHSDPSYSMPYRIAGVWAGQQGSFLLWASAAAVFGLLASRGTGEFRRWFTVFYSVFLSAIAGILAFESPFKLVMAGGLPVVPNEGAGMSPALLNYWITIHPPVIFLGFGALTVLAAYGFAALATNKLQEWVPMVRPWAIVAATLTGLGLCMGGFWAYETLGWGGFWMWDPVENVSFVPWVLSLGLVHGIIVQITRKQWTVTNLMLAGLPFLLFVYGTFLTRSGVLSETSVHSFAEMDKIALKLLMGLMTVTTVGYVGLWAWRSIQFKRSNVSADMVVKGVNREGFYRLGVLMLVLVGLLAAVGMSVPMAMSLMGKKAQIVEEPLYHKTLVWVYVPLLFAMALAPMASWRGMKFKDFFSRSYGVLCVTLVGVGLAMMAAAGTPIIRGIGPEAAVTMPGGFKVGAVHWVLFLAGLSIAALVANVWRMIETVKGSKLAWGAFLSHVSVAILMAGLIVSRGLERKEQLFVQENGHNGALGYMISYKGQTKTSNDRENEVLFEMSKGSDEKWMASPGFYYAKTLDGRENPVSWPHIERFPLHDIYVALHPPVTDATDERTIKIGQTIEMDRFKVTNMGNTREGEAGATGTSFGVKLQVSAGHNQIIINPHIELGKNGIEEHTVPVDKQVVMAMKSMDAATGDAVIQLRFAKPLYPVEVFYKPLTGLVWLGTFMMLVSGMIAALYRRRRTAKQGQEKKETTEVEELIPALAR
jgi:cytochrome c-type biogenesis protein CcmF